MISPAGAHGPTFRPLGPWVDSTPRPLPSRVPIKGTFVQLEPLHVRHVPELWRAAAGADESWDYLGYGPFATEAALRSFVGDFAATFDPLAYAVRPAVTGLASGWLTLMTIEPRHAHIELGNVWLGPVMQRTRAATEAMFLAMQTAMEELGYRRLTWKCNALNAASRRAAARFGFTFEGVLRAHMVVKGRLRDTAYYSLLDQEWPCCRAALTSWLQPSNFNSDGTAVRGLADIRAGLATSQGGSIGVSAIP